MAKITLENGMVLEGTPEELVELSKGFEAEEKPVYIEEPKELPLKIGDYVRVIGNPFAINIGDLAEITDEGGLHDFIVKRLSDDVKDAFNAEHLVKATEEEVVAVKTEIEAKESQRKLEAKWSKIGRKVNEFKKGDIISTRYYGILEVVKVDSFGAHPIHVVINKKDDALTTKSCTLITPVEARFDR